MTDDSGQIRKAGTEARPTGYFKLYLGDYAPIDECVEANQAND